MGGRTPDSLSREFEPTAQSIWNWVRQAERGEGTRTDGLTTEEKEELRRLRRENRVLRGEGDPEKSRGLVRSGDRLYAPRAFEFVSDHRAEFAGKRMCRLLGVSTSGYYAWCQREPSTRSCADETLERRIMEIHQGSRGTYGVPRIHAELAADGVAVGRKRVSRLMRRAGIQGISRRGRAWTTRRARDARPASDLVERDFGAPGADQLWVADITNVPTWAGFLYLAVVVDAWSRRVVGWAMANDLRTELVLDARNMALGQRPASAVIHHSDQGCQAPGRH